MPRMKKKKERKTSTSPSRCPECRGPRRQSKRMKMTMIKRKTRKRSRRKKRRRRLLLSFCHPLLSPKIQPRRNVCLRRKRRN